MSGLGAALWAEALKARRSKVPWLAGLGLMAVPLVGGLFMVILKDPARARDLGLLGAKAQLAAGRADWPTYAGLLAQAVAVGGALVFAFVAAWVFGREAADRTMKELLALPTARGAVVTAKLAVVAAWAAAVTALILGLAWVLGQALDLPGGSAELAARATADLLVIALMTLGLMTPVAFLASAGRGYLPPLGWAVLTLVLAQIAAALGWGGVFPWAVPALYSGLAGPRSELVGPHSLALVALVAGLGLVATYAWWLRADQTG